MDEQALIDILKNSDDDDLQTLIEAKKEAKERVIKDPSAENLKAFDQVSALLVRYLTPKSDIPFKTRMEVLEYLKSEGYKIGKSKLYNDCDKNILAVEKDGTVTREAVANYIKYHLADNSDDEFNKERAQAEVRRATAQAEHWELRTKLQKERFIPRIDYERELAAKAILIKSGLENIARGNAAEIIALVDGNPEKIIDLMEYLSGCFAEYLNQFAQAREFEVIMEDDGDAGEEEDEQ
jgi:hypothetical protein